MHIYAHMYACVYKYRYIHTYIHKHICACVQDICMYVPIYKHMVNVSSVHTDADGTLTRVPLSFSVALLYVALPQTRSHELVSQATVTGSSLPPRL